MQPKLTPSGRLINDKNTCISVNKLIKRLRDQQEIRDYELFENSQIMKFLFHTGNNLHYDFCIIEAMFEKAMFLGGLVTVSTETSFNSIFH